MNSRLGHLCLGGLVAVVIGMRVGAASAATQDDFSLALSVGAWGTCISGDTGIGDFSAPVSASFCDLIDDAQFALFGGVEIEKNNWVVAFNGMFVGLEDDVSLRDGRGADIDAEIGVLDLALGYTILRAKMENGMPISITPAIGVRWTYLELEIDPNNFATRDGDENWFDPYVGGRIVIGLTNKLDWRTEGTIGGFGVGSDLTWTAGSYLDWQFAEHLSFNIGYRALAWNYDNDGFEWDMTLQGPWVGLTIR